MSCAMKDFNGCDAAGIWNLDTFNWNMSNWKLNDNFWIWTNVTRSAVFIYLFIYVAHECMSDVMFLTN